MSNFHHQSGDFFRTVMRQCRSRWITARWSSSFTHTVIHSHHHLIKSSFTSILIHSHRPSLISSFTHILIPSHHHSFVSSVTNILIHTHCHSLIVCFTLNIIHSHNYLQKSSQSLPVMNVTRDAAVPCCEKAMLCLLSLD